MELLFCCIFISFLISSLFYMITKKEDDNLDKKQHESITIWFLSVVSSFAIITYFYKNGTKVYMGGDPLSRASKAPF